jgi:multidrug efflux pump subunit AcrB
MNTLVAASLFTLICVIVLTVHLYNNTPKGLFPDDDTGLIMANTEAAADISCAQMVKLQTQALDIILKDPAVEHIGSSVGASGFSASVNQG